MDRFGWVVELENVVEVVRVALGKLSGVGVVLPGAGLAHWHVLERQKIWRDLLAAGAQVDFHLFEAEGTTLCFHLTIIQWTVVMKHLFFLSQLLEKYAYVGILSRVYFQEK